MPRPRRHRRVRGLPPAGLFKPAGVPARQLDEVVLTVDQYEALRLADYEGLYQDDAASRMGISRPTFSRLVESARRIVARALVEGAALRIEGGDYVTVGARQFACVDCGHSWSLSFGTGRPEACPACSATQIHRTDGGPRGHGRGGGRGRRGRGCNRPD